jgi:archaellum component FlaF (FlaF/FlaG flagellin family)
VISLTPIQNIYEYGNSILEIGDIEYENNITSIKIRSINLGSTTLVVDSVSVTIDVF